MNLKIYYQKIRDIEHTLVGPYAVLESNETTDGGKEGLLTEVPRQLAAKMIADGRVRLATEPAIREFHEKKAEAKRMAEQEAITGQVRMMSVPAEMIRTKRSPKE